MLSARLHLYPPANFLIFHIDFEPTMRYLHKIKDHIYCVVNVFKQCLKSSIEFLRIFTIIGIIKYFLQIYKSCYSVCHLCFIIFPMKL